MLTYDQALQRVHAAITPLPAINQPLKDANGLILAAPALARWDMPRLDNSAMDGFAFAATSAKSTKTLKVVGRSFAGHPFDRPLQNGEAIQITTGAPLPEGADSVIPIEDAVTKEDMVSLQTDVRMGQCQNP